MSYSNISPVDLELIQADTLISGDWLVAIESALLSAECYMYNSLRTTVLKHLEM